MMFTDGTKEKAAEMADRYRDLIADCHTKLRERLDAAEKYLDKDMAPAGLLAVNMEEILDEAAAHTARWTWYDHAAREGEAAADAWLIRLVAASFGSTPAHQQAFRDILRDRDAAIAARS